MRFKVAGIICRNELGGKFISRGFLVALLACSVQDASGYRMPFDCPPLERAGYIDRTGKTIVGPTFDETYRFSKGLAAVGFIAIPSSNCNQPNLRDPYKFFFSLKKGSFRGQHYNPIGPMTSDGLAVIEIPFRDRHSESQPRLTYIDDSGSIKNERFKDCGNFVNGFAIVEKQGLSERQVSSEGRVSNVMPEPTFHIIDKNMKTVVDLDCKPYQPNEIFPQFSEGLIAVVSNSRIGYADTTGKIVIKPRYAMGSTFSEGLAAVQDSSGKFGYIDHSGKVKIPCMYLSANDFHDGRAFVRCTNEKQGFIDANNTFKFAVSPSCETADFSDGIACVREGLRTKCFDKDGNVLYSTASIVKQFHEGLAATSSPEVFATTKPRWGYIDKSFRWVVQPTLLKAGDFSEGLAAVTFHALKKTWTENKSLPALYNDVQAPRSDHEFFARLVWYFILPLPFYAIVFTSYAYLYRKNIPK